MKESTMNLKRYPIQVLSPREKVILRLISHGYTIQQISEQLFITCETVKSHRKNLYNKLQVHNAAGLVRRAFELGYLKLQAVST